MAAYVISEVEMLDETQGRRYRERRRVDARHGGRYLVRGAAPVVAEGNWPASVRIVIVEFPSIDRCTWSHLRRLRRGPGRPADRPDRRLLFVDGTRTHQASAGQPRCRLRRRSRWPSPPPSAPPRGPRRAGPHRDRCRRISRRAVSTRRPRPALSTPGRAARRSSPGRSNR